MTTIATLLSGGELVGVGARAAGLTHLWGFEIDDNIAGVARDNGFNVITADVMTLDPATLEVPDALHVSTVCKRASGANQSAELNEDGTKEAPEDRAMGEKIAQFIDVMTPRIVTIENVYAYRNFQAFKTICAALNRNGYMWDFDNLNSADFGVPQSRRRLILRAVRGALLPNLPQPVRWVGWYEAIEDLIPTLPESQFAAWQLERLPEELKTALVSSIDCTIRDLNEPANTLVCTGDGHSIAPRAFIVGTNANETSGAKIYQEADEPSFTVTANSNQTGVRAFIVDCQKAGDTSGDRFVTLRQSNEPMFTVTSGKGKRQPVRAYLVESKNIQEWGDSKRADFEPAMTVTTDPKDSHRPKAWLSQGRVVSMTPRALARFQSIPDDYRLPDNKRLACTVIGNGVPCLLYQRIIEGLAA